MCVTTGSVNFGRVTKEGIQISTEIVIRMTHYPGFEHFSTVKLLVSECLSGLTSLVVCTFSSKTKADNI